MKLIVLLSFFIASFSASAQVTGLAAVLKDGKWGYIDTKGNWAIPPRFDGAQPFSEGLAAVNIGWGGGNDPSTMSAGKWGYIDAAGNWVIEPQFTDISEFSEELACVNIGAAMIRWDLPTVSGGQWGFIDRKGNWVIQAKDSIKYSSFSEGLACFRRIGRDTYGFIDKKGNIVIDDQIDATDFSHGYSVVLNEIFMDKKGKHVKSFTMATPFTMGMACVKDDESFYMVNKDLKKLFDVPEMCWVSDSLIKARELVDDKYLTGYMNMKGKWVIEPKYAWASSFSEGFAIVQETATSPYLCIDKKGNVVFTIDAPVNGAVSFMGVQQGLLLQYPVDPSYFFTFIDMNGKPAFKETFAGAFHFTSVK